MYLKSIEVQGFKSFANKIVFDFHNGITGIVGPNGSGKSNVADAVRWVLGEQSARQLRGSSMQDVIFSGTETRKPLSYAYVAITMDNADHALAIDFEEVTVARRVYRSGESEYRINGSPCRLRDVTELFYDTGIGKEGYSIIGQGQIEQILSGKPEERRELFDEAAGIVKFKKRKAAAQKKLESERENIVRVDDILSELSRQVGPLEQQAEKARGYLRVREELKGCEVNLFLLEREEGERRLSEVRASCEIADRELGEANEAYEGVRDEYERLERDMAAADGKIESLRGRIQDIAVNKGKLEGDINVLREQIQAAQATGEHLGERIASIEREGAAREAALGEFERERGELEGELKGAEAEREEAAGRLRELQGEVSRCTGEIERGRSEIIELLNHSASTKARQGRFDTMIEQTNIRKAQVSKSLLERKSQESEIDQELEGYRRALGEAGDSIKEHQGEVERLEKKDGEWQAKARETGGRLEEAIGLFHKDQSRLESLRNIAERYDGYGSSIRRVMEQKPSNKGLLGVVSDIIQVDREYETAIETALGGSIQNIVTEDEETAKRMIAFLKENRYGRATFLPLTSVKGVGAFRTPEALGEPGVIGLANTLVKTEKRFEGVASYLLGRVLVAESLGRATEIARKYRYQLSIVTLEGEYLRPGGSMTGGAFKNASSLLARNREIDELSRQVEERKREIKDLRNRQEEIKAARALLADDLEHERLILQEQVLAQNTAQVNVERATRQKEEGDEALRGLMEEGRRLDEQIRAIEEEKGGIADEIRRAAERQAILEEEGERLQRELEEASKKEEAAQAAAGEAQLREASLRQKAEFALVNLERLRGEIRELEEEKGRVLAEAEDAKSGASQKGGEIEALSSRIRELDEEASRASGELDAALSQKEAFSSDYKGFFQKREEIADRISSLDKEVFRLNAQREKIEGEQLERANYIWGEYELTPRTARELRDESLGDIPALKRRIESARDEIRSLGDVNVNAIEDYREVSERYEFLKSQREDLAEAEQTLLGIIGELDEGMRSQFLEKFEQIRVEFDKAFKELFGGGKGALSLVEGEDVLECGIRIIAQPPGKKLQNMMQMSGGEKALTAIALLFAIQNLKPSPFCLLDEIEAALDDSNVGRFARYLHKLTANTQFIVITHRRGTMAAADRLYGITMQEKGVSTLVSVDLIEGDLDK